MWFAAIIMWALGGLLAVLGLLLWKKEKISLLHSYHYDKVTEEDKKVFCAWSGIGVLVVGLGMIVTGVLMVFTESPMRSLIAFCVGFVIGLGMLIYAGVRYN